MRCSRDQTVGSGIMGGGERCRDPCVRVCVCSVTSSSVDGGGRGPTDETDAKAFGRPFRILNYPKQSEISSQSILTLGPTQLRGRARDTFAYIQNAPNRFKAIPIHTGQARFSLRASFYVCQVFCLHSFGNGLSLNTPQVRAGVGRAKLAHKNAWPLISPWVNKSLP